MNVIQTILDYNKSKESGGKTDITKSDIISALGYTPISELEKGANSGIAELDDNGKVLTSELPSYVDDVEEFNNLAELQKHTGEASKIYITLDDNKCYRWGGTAYVEISSSITLGETSGTAFRGDLGKEAYDKSHTHSNKEVIDSITSEDITNWNNKSDFDGKYTSLTDTPTIPTVTNDLTNELKANYDLAYTQTHTHSNKELLDKLSLNKDNKLLYNGDKVDSDVDLTAIIDDSTITDKTTWSSNKINTTIPKTWVGTKADYEQIKDTLENGTIVYITDDESVILYDKAEMEKIAAQVATDRKAAETAAQTALESAGSVNQLKKDLGTVTSDRFSLAAFNNGYLTNRYDALAFEGGFILNDGSDGAESKLRIRSKKYVPFFDKALVTDKEEYNFTLFKYDKNGIFVESYKNLKETLSHLDSHCLYRISVVRDDGGKISPSDNPIMLLYKKNEFVENDKLEKSLIKKIGAKIDKNDIEAKAYINGAYVETQSRLITKSYYLFDDNMFVRNNGKYTYSVYYFDENFRYLDNSVWKAQDGGIDAEKPVNTKYIKFGIKTADNSAITDDYEAILDSFRIVNRFDRPFVALNSVPLAYYEGLQSEYNFDTSKNASEYLQAFKMLIDEDANATTNSLGLDSSGKDMYAYTIKPPTILYEKLHKKPNTRAKILIVSGQHGFEKGSVYGLYYFVKDLIENYDKNDSLAYIRGNIELSIIPIANRYGFDNNLYENANNVNLNRNYEDGFVAGEKNGNTALDQPETKLINDWIKNNSDALALIDFHTNGKQILTDWKNVNWLSIPYMETPYSDIVYDVCTRQISDNTARFKKEFNLELGKDVSLGHVDEWKNQPCLDAQAVLNNMIGITCEGFPGFVGAESIYDSNSMKANSEIIGNIILNLLRGFSS